MEEEEEEVTEEDREVVSFKLSLPHLERTASKRTKRRSRELTSFFLFLLLFSRRRRIRRTAAGRLPGRRTGRIRRRRYVAFPLFFPLPFPFSKRAKCERSSHLRA